jgi:C-terminal processing protease CtpA/Prc
VTGGDVDWDRELFRVLPGVLAARDRSAAHASITTWLAELGDAPPCSPCATAPQDVHIATDLDWMDDASLGEELSRRLRQIHSNRSVSAQQRHVSLAPNVGNPVFREEAYPLQSSPDAGYRLLALFRYWNIIQYWFPYRDLIDDDWQAVLREFIPVIAQAEDANAYRLAMLRLVARIHDTHASLGRAHPSRPPQGVAQLPVIIRFVEGHAVVTGYSHDELGPATGLQRGDAIVTMDGARIDSLVAAWTPFYPASNQPARLHDIARTLTRGPAGSVRLGVLREGRMLDVAAERAPISVLNVARGETHDLPGETFRMLSDDVAYLKLSSVRVADVPDYFRRAADAKVFVIDIRNYPSQFVVMPLAGRLVERPTPFARFTVGSPANPGTFTFTQPIVVQPVGPRYTGTVVVLVDETSISQSEYTTMALRAGANTIVVGSTTAAADGNISPFVLPGGLETLITGIGVFYPDNTPTQRVGIVPDLEVRPTMTGIREGRDEVLEAGVSRALGREFRL